MFITEISYTLSFTVCMCVCVWFELEYLVSFIKSRKTTANKRTYKNISTAKPNRSVANRNETNGRLEYTRIQTPPTIHTEMEKQQLHHAHTHTLTHKQPFWNPFQHSATTTNFNYGYLLLLLSLRTLLNRNKTVFFPSKLAEIIYVCVSNVGEPSSRQAKGDWLHASVVLIVFGLYSDFRIEFYKLIGWHSILLLLFDRAEVFVLDFLYCVTTLSAPHLLPTFTSTKAVPLERTVLVCVSIDFCMEIRCCCRSILIAWWIC